MTKPTEASRLRWGCLIAAAGRGDRFGGGLPKQFAPLGSRPVLDWSLSTLMAIPEIVQIVLILPPGAARGSWTIPSDPRVTAIDGGDRRQDSVSAGLSALLPGIDAVLVHDAARPLAGAASVRRVMEETARTGAAIPVLPVRDTLKRVDGGRVKATVDREGLFTSQTPQGFLRSCLEEALAAAGDVTDECAALEAAGMEVGTVEGDRFAAKLTDPEDLPFLEALAGRSSYPGIGIDFHPFGGSGPLMVCGLELAPGGGLSGHSDGDVALHAVADAMLSAARLGDIGQFFPPGAPEWKGADSGFLLGIVAKAVAASGHRLIRLDLTLIGERPRVSEHRDRMIARLSELLGVSESSIWVKGTTTNSLGDIGKGRGLAAVALVALERA